MSTVKEQIKVLRKKKDDLAYEIEELAKSKMSEFSIEHTLGYWDCPDSPIGLCVYNHFEDRALDGCLFCHHPHERK
jgi:hypothetical protein